MPPRKLYPGQSLTATEQNALVAKVARLGRVSGTGQTTVGRDDDATSVRDNRLDTIYARITGAPTGSKYPWIEVVRETGGTYTDVAAPFGRTGTAADLPAVEITGNTSVPTGAIVELSVLPGGGGWGFTWGAGGIVTANVDTSEESTTTRLEFDQDTGIRVDAGATDADPDTVSIDPDVLVDTLTFDVDVQVPTCISVILTKTYAATTLGGESVLTNVTAAVAWKTKTVSMLANTTVSAAGACVAPPSCCPTGAVSLACGDGVTYTTLTFSNKTLDCTCLPATGTYVVGSYPSGDLYAEWSTAGCPGNVAWELKCVDDVYLLYAGGVACTPVSAVAGSMVFDSPNLGANCGGAGGTVRATITP